MSSSDYKAGTPGRIAKHTYGLLDNHISILTRVPKTSTLQGFLTTSHSIRQDISPMCILIIRTWDPCLHMRCTATDRCTNQVSSPGLSEYDCPDAHTIYVDDATDYPCPVCRPTMVVQRLEDLLHEAGLQTGEDQEALTGASTSSSTDDTKCQRSHASNERATNTATVCAPGPVSPRVPAKEVLDGSVEDVEVRRDAHDARNRGRGAADRPSLAKLTSAEMCELSWKEVLEDGM